MFDVASAHLGRRANRLDSRGGMGRQHVVCLLKVFRGRSVQMVHCLLT